MNPEAEEGRRSRRVQRRKSPYGDQRDKMVLTRSKTSQLDSEERRQFLEQGAVAATAAAQAGQPQRRQGTQPPVADPARPELQVQPPGAEAAPPQGHTLSKSIHADTRTFNVGQTDSPRSPSVDVLRERSRRPRVIPLEPLVQVKPSPRQGRERHTTVTEQQPSKVTFSGVSNRTNSVRSKASSVAEARRKEAELEASERLAEIRRQELQLQAELVRKRLETRLAQIDLEGSEDSLASSDKGERVREWLDNSDRQAEDLTPHKRRANDEAPADTATPRRSMVGCASEERKRHRSREERDRTPSPSAGQHTPRTKDSNLAESMIELFKNMQTAARPTPKNIYELPEFNGDVSEWRSFYNIYQETDKRYRFSSYGNVARLRAALKGEAKASVKHILSGATRPDFILKILKKQFGRSELLLDRALEDLRRLEQVGPTPPELNSFSIKVVNIISTIMDLDDRNYADVTTLVREITRCLTPHLLSRWCDYAKLHRADEEPEIVKLADFLMEESELQMEFSHARATIPSRRAAAARDHGARATDVQPLTARGGRGRAVNAPNRPRGGVKNHVFSVDTEKAMVCLFCGGRHFTSECRKLAGKTLGSRFDWARLNGICYKCLNAKHRRDSCKAKGCGVKGCPYSHHKLLHREREVLAIDQQVAATDAVAPPPRAAESPSLPARAQSPIESPQETHARTYTSTTTRNSVLLKVIPVTLSGPAGVAHIFAMMDDASTISLLDEDIAEQIGAKGPEAPLNVRGIGNISHRAYTQTVKATVRPERGGEAYELTLRTVSGLGLRSQTLEKEKLLKYAHLQDLGEACYTTGVPQMLIGADHWYLLVPTEIRTGRRNEPAAMKLPLGWAFFGMMPRIISTNEQVTLHCHEEDDRLDEIMKQHWAIEALGVSKKESVKPADQKALDIFNSTVRKVGERYEVGQLWAQDDAKLPSSYNMAYKRLRILEAKMDRDKEFGKQYELQITNLLEEGYAERLRDVPVSNRAWFLPHFAVYNANKEKYRAVFDCAAKSQGHALNDFVLQGPDLLCNLVGILLRFREWKFAVTADIAEMFLRIQLRREDANSQLFLWRGEKRDCAPQIYRLNRVCFGCISSPFLAHAVRNRNAEDNEQEFPLAVNEIKFNHYMDDYVASYNTEEELIETANQVTKSHARAGFHLRSYAANSGRMLAALDPELLANEPTTLGQSDQKVLGMTWDPAIDAMGFNTRLLRASNEVKACSRAPTKRELLSIIMSIYDPLGLISHYSISARIIYQRVWLKNVAWDAPLPEEEAGQFFQWMAALQSVAALRIPRWYGTTVGSVCSLHIFTDASTEAYCATAYWRMEDARGGDVRVCLAAAKARVCPLKVITVPRLELSAAVMGLRLAQTIIQEQRYAVSGITYWTDSKTVVNWIRDDARNYKPFVSHRLAEIVEASDRQAWRWVPTKLNPADAGTRCRPERRVSIDEDWYQGPSFLRRPEAEWPQENVSVKSTELPERKAAAIAATTCALRDHMGPTSVLPRLDRFSNHDRLINSTSYVLLFIEKLRTRNRTLQLQVRHINQAEHMWVQNSQRRSFPAEVRALSRGEELDRKSKLYSLAPELCSDGVMRMKTRLGNAPVAYTCQRPVILDGRDPYVRLLIARAHRRSMHIHNEAVVNMLRQDMWILHLWPAVKAVARACALCQVRRANPRAQPLGDLPPERLQPYQRPFTFSAQDYMGPLTVTVGRRHEKRWVALYTCLTTRAVHLEIVHGLSSDSAIMALRRFAARRGWPRVMYSDNATCFRAADVELREAYRDWLPRMQSYGVQERMQWKFIPPGNPSAGGVWERLIRTVKAAMARVLHTRAPKEELLCTIIAEIETIINNRPLTHVPTGHDEPEALTPAHFLMQRATELPSFGGNDPDNKKQWRAAQALADHFWRRWVAEYLPLLAPRQSSSSGGRQVQVGDVVIVADPNGPRNTWPRGLVVATYPGPDKETRSVDIKTAHGTLRRPTCRLAVVASQPMHPQPSAEGTNVSNAP